MRKLLYVALVLAFTLGGVVFTIRQIGAKRYRDEVARIEAEGGSLRLDAYAPLAVPEAENGALLYESAWTGAGGDAPLCAGARRRSRRAAAPLRGADRYRRPPAGGVERGGPTARVFLGRPTRPSQPVASCYGRARRGAGDRCYLLPDMNRTTPPASASPPTIGEIGMVSFVVVEAWIGPRLKVFGLQ